MVDLSRATPPMGHRWTTDGPQMDHTAGRGQVTLTGWTDSGDVRPTLRLGAGRGSQADNDGPRLPQAQLVVRWDHTGTTTRRRRDRPGPRPGLRRRARGPAAPAASEGARHRSAGQFGRKVAPGTAHRGT